jgi:serine/threonine-protein kinase RsbT
MGESVRVPIEIESDIVVARRKGREVSVQVGLSGSDPTLVATAISEISRNILVYAQRGEIVITQLREWNRSGILVVARDSGPGIRNVDLAMQDGYSTGKSLGLGLPGAKRLMDEFTIESTVGTGTTITMKKWARVVW